MQRNNYLAYNREFQELFTIKVNLYNYKYILSRIDEYYDNSNDVMGFCLLQERLERDFLNLFEKNFHLFKINLN